MRFVADLKPRILVVAAVIGVLSVILVIGASNAVGAKDAKVVAVNQIIEREGVTVTLDTLAIGTETLLNYSYKSISGLLIEPLGEPVMRLRDGTQLLAQNRGIANEIDVTQSGEKYTVRAAFPQIPTEYKDVAVDLGSYIVYTSDSGKAELHLDNQLLKVGTSSTEGYESVLISEPFSIGPAQYRFVALALSASDTPPVFVIVYEPTNDIASRTVPVGALSQVRLYDDLGNEYSHTLATADWYLDSGHKMSRQSLYFDGLPDPQATSFTLEFTRIGQIKTPFIFDVNL